MNVIEIELRFELLNPMELTTFLSTLTTSGTKRIIDIYLDTPNIELLKKGVYVRIRNGKHLDIKFNRECLINPHLDLQPYCEEYSFDLPLHEFDADDFNSIVKTVGLLPISKPDFDHFQAINNLSTHRIVDKIRTSYSMESFTIVIDDVDQLGIYLEIEAMANNTETVEHITQRMNSLLKPLTLKPLQTGYDSLILRRHNFDEYLQGRFILDEDKPLRKKLAFNQL